MKVLYSWLQDYIEEELPDPDEVARALTMHSFEVEEVEEVDGDYLFDVDVLPNRASDALSHLGIAREISILFNLTLTLPEIKLKEVGDFSSKDLLSFSIDPHFARRGMKRVVKNVSVRESPDWLKKKLELLGQRSINNIVDITNFVMFEIGQPVHAFDYDKIADNDPKQVDVRAASPGETITTLDGEEYELTEDMAVIADDEKALDIAGVKGGKVSGIDKNTDTVLLSVCSFNPTAIRKTSQELGLRTDASKRFENDPSPDLVGEAMDRLTFLLSKYAKGLASKDLLDVYPRPRNPYKVGVTAHEMNRLLGLSLGQSEIEDILDRLSFEHEFIDPLERVVHSAEQHVDAPYKYGASVSFDAPDFFDCSSFTAYVYAQAGISIPRVTIDQYVYGYEVVRDDLEPGDIVFSKGHSDKEEKEFVRMSDNETVSKKITNYETIDYMPGTPVEEGIDHCGIYLGDGEVIHASGNDVNNKVVVEKIDESQAFSQVRGYRRMIDDKEEGRFVVTIPHYRRDIRIPEDLIEEIGRINGYENIPTTAPDELTDPQDEEYKSLFIKYVQDLLVSEGFSEVHTYAFISEGDIEVKNPIADDKNFLRSNTSEGIQHALALNGKNTPLFESETLRIFEIGKVFTADSEYYTLTLGVQEENNKKTKQTLDAIEEVFEKKCGVPLKGKGLNGVREYNLSEYMSQVEDFELSEKVKQKIGEATKFKKISQYPFVLRDIAVWVPEKKKPSDVLEKIEASAGDLLVNSRLFDEYDKDGRTSYAYKLVFQSNDQTLSDQRVNEIMDAVSQELNAQKGWKVR